jgi:hypothetical protein
LKVKQDTTKFVAETIGKETYSKRSNFDLTSKGEKIGNIIFEYPDDDKKEI